MGDTMAGQVRGGGRGQGPHKGGRPPTGTVPQGAPRWCKPLFVANPGKGDALMRALVQTGKEGDKNKIICRMCSQAISFSASSCTMAAKHVGTHGVSRDNLEVAVAFANKAEEDGMAFPLPGMEGPPPGWGRAAQGGHVHETGTVHCGKH